jgi:hypothetical protein
MSPSTTTSSSQEEARAHPRASLVTKAKLSFNGDGRSFQASLSSQDVSLGGIFFESEFALKLGSELDVRFELPDGSGVVEARGRIVRVEHYDERSGRGRSGFAVRFTEFQNDGGVVLASLFLAPRLRQFASRYLKERSRHRRGMNELDRLVDALVVWELERTEGQMPVE